MSRVQRIITASGLILIAGFALVVTASQIGVTWYSAPDETGVATKQVGVFEPAVVGTVVAGLAVVVLLAFLLVAIRRVVSRRMWATALGVSIVAVVAAVLVSMASRPTF
ncbi:hypothetical protein C5E11_10860 [Clavibacter michiganensis]|nr:hypothetical protein [Clavibacter michiganensis]PPF62402.1 hypothetical protein C5E11_10860 [Clavibacter michiganensis]